MNTHSSWSFDQSVMPREARGVMNVSEQEGIMVLDTKGLFSTVDRMDAKGFAAYFTEDGLFRFGNAPTVKGRDEIASSVEGFFASIKALSHRIVDQWSVEGVDIVEVEVTYTREDDSQVDLTAACLFRLQGDLVSDYRIYMDINPLFAPA